VALGGTCRRAVVDRHEQHERHDDADDEQPARFAADDAEAELRAGFDVLAEAIGDDGDGAATEVSWSTLHGISLLERGRMRPQHRAQRVAELGARVAVHPSR
jgi:hypothetical protein